MSYARERPCGVHVPVQGNPCSKGSWVAGNLWPQLSEPLPVMDEVPQFRALAIPRTPKRELSCALQAPVPHCAAACWQVAISASPCAPSRCCLLASGEQRRKVSALPCYMFKQLMHFCTPFNPAATVCDVLLAVLLAAELVPDVLSLLSKGWQPTGHRDYAGRSARWSSACLSLL